MIESDIIHGCPRVATVCRVKCAAIYTNSKAKMIEVNPIVQTLKDLRERTDVLRGYL